MENIFVEILMVVILPFVGYRSRIYILFNFSFMAHSFIRPGVLQLEKFKALNAQLSLVSVEAYTRFPASHSAIDTSVHFACATSVWHDWLPTFNPVINLSLSGRYKIICSFRTSLTPTQRGVAWASSFLAYRRRH